MTLSCQLSGAERRRGAFHPALQGPLVSFFKKLAQISTWARAARLFCSGLCCMASISDKVDQLLVADPELSHLHAQARLAEILAQATHLPLNAI
jgi:hypothetical protein